MATRTPLTVALLVLVGLFGCSTTPPPDAGAGTGAVLSPQDESALRATLAALADAWNRHDMNAMRDLLSEDVQWVLQNGNVWRDRQTVYSGYDTLHRSLDTRSWMSTLTIEQIELRSLAPQVAVVLAKLSFGKGMSQADPETIPETIPERQTRSSFVMMERGGVWKIAHFHSTTLPPVVEAQDPLWGTMNRR